MNMTNEKIGEINLDLLCTNGSAVIDIVLGMY
jgi:hypothetical protein